MNDRNDRTGEELADWIRVGISVERDAISIVKLLKYSGKMG